MKNLSPLKSFAVAALFILTINSCNKSIPLVPDASPEVKVASNYSVLSVRDFELSAETGDLYISFYESQRFFIIPASDTDFQTLFNSISKSKMQHLPVRVILGSGNAILGVTPAAAEEMAAFSKRFTADETDREQYIDVVSSMQELDQIFAFIVKQNCEDGNPVLDYCIPFQYKIDGCYARAHKMRQILELHYGYTCNKIFSFDHGIHPLAVDAGDCCVFWGWHDAPVVKVNTPAGVISRVIDPSLFDHPVSIKDWLAIQETTSCNPKADVGSYEIVPGSWYLSDGTKDPNYVSTNLVLALYRNLQTCQ